MDDLDEVRSFDAAEAPRRSTSSLEVMETTAPSFQEFAALLRHEIAEVRSPLRREFIERLLVAPHQVTLHWKYGNAETYQAWVFANMPDGDVVAQLPRRLRCDGQTVGHSIPACLAFWTGLGLVSESRCIDRGMGIPRRPLTCVGAHTRRSFVEGRRDWMNLDKAASVESMRQRAAQLGR